jgi:sugar phosphate isomerase/epimerase
MNRRTFLQTSGLATLASLAAQAAPNAKSVGLQLYTLRDDIGKMGIEKVLAEVARLGYKKVESFSYGNGKIFGKTPAEYRKLLADNGLTAPSGHYMTGRSKAMKMDGLTNNWQKVVDDAATMGQQFMVIAFLMPDERKPADYQQLYGLLNEGGETVRKAGMQLCYHNHDFEFTEKVDGQKPYDLLLKNTNPALVKMEVDLYWMTKAGESPEAYFKAHPGRFPLWHVKDMANTPQKEFAEVGTGTVDFAAIFKHAKQAGLKHYFVEQDVCKRPPLEAIKISIDNIQKAKWG